MADGKTTVIFDTSGINCLLEDQQTNAVIGKLETGFRVRLSGASIEELIATRNSDKRRSLIELCERLLPIGDCLSPHQDIIWEMARCHQRYGERFEWRDVDVTAPKMAREIIDKRFLGNDVLSEESREWARRENERFLSIFRRSSDRSEAETLERLQALSLQNVLEICRQEGGELWKHVAGLYERARLIRPGEEDIRRFVAQCPPVHALALGTMIAYYHHAIPKKHGKKFTAGRMDFFMAIYLPYCRIFVSNDADQCDALTVVAKEADLGTDIVRYGDFVQRLLADPNAPSA